MIWTVVSIILVCIVKILMTCLPTGPVEWLIRKFAIHTIISDENATVTFDGKRFEGEDKIRVIKSFNEAIFLEKQYIYPGTEELFLHPKNSETPIIIDSKRGKTNIRLFLFQYTDRVDVVKQYKKKVIAYSLLSDSLQKQSINVTRKLV
jgi:hypothetical protein